jgi:hypothetical protein
MSKKKTTVVLSVQELRKRKSGSYMIREVADEDIDCSEIPEFTEEQLRKFRPLSKKKRKLFK